MSQIDISILHQGYKSNKVLTCCLFKMVNFYRSFEAYETHFKNFLKKASKSLPEFEIRVYTDDTAKDFCLKMTSDYKALSVYHYNCPIFREGNGHTGIFGMFTRFLPLFEKGLEIVWVTDIDITNDFLDYEILSLMKKHNTDVFIDTALCSERKPWLKVKYPIIAHRFISFITYPKQLLTRFLNKLNDGDLDVLVNDMNEYNTRKHSSKLPYGIDEAFLNSYLYHSIKNADVNVLIHKNYFAVSNFFQYNINNFPSENNIIMEKYYRHQTPELFKKTKKIFLESIPKLTDKYPCMQEFLDVSDTLKTSFIKIFIISSNNL